MKRNYLSFLLIMVSSCAQAAAIGYCPAPPPAPQGPVSANWWGRYSSWCSGCGGTITSYDDGSKGCTLPAPAEKPARQRSMRSGLVEGAVSMAIQHFFLSDEANESLKAGEQKQSGLIDESQTLLQGDQTPKEKFNANDVMDVKASSTWEQFKRKVRQHQHDLTAENADNKKQSDWCDSNTPLAGSATSVAKWKKACNGDSFVDDANPPAKKETAAETGLEEFTKASQSASQDAPAAQEKQSTHEPAKTTDDDQQ